ncbi:MAG: ABC transporter permease [Syntrophorhabdales bacterium]|jgi:ABC-type nitrate/sulfonate/bicarbonate transport system permease component
MREFFSTKAKGICFLLFLALLWEIVSRNKLISPLYFPPISRDLVAFYQLMLDGTLPLEVIRSLGRIFGGFFLAVAVMVPLGIVMGLFKPAYNLFEPITELIRPLPPPAIIPVVMLFLGIGEAMKIIVIAFACSFPILINTMDGVRSVEPTLVDTAKTFGRNRYEIILQVILPASLHQIFTGWRVALPIALIVDIVAEMVGALNGIGRFILLMQRRFDIPEMYAGIFLVAIVGYALNALLRFLNKSLIGWHQAKFEAVT